MPAPVLLTDTQIQDYLTHGYLVLRTGHPDAFHQRVLRQIETLYATAGNPGNDILPRVPDLYGILRDPAVDGALRSLLGADYLLHPHRHCHENPRGSGGQEMHQDSYENDQNVRHHRTRWAMAFYYPQDVPLEMGPTAILPASQYYESGAQARQREELALCGAAGTVTIVHYDLWHRAMANTGDRHRYMVKFLFTRMSEPRAATWDHRAAAFDLAGDDPPASLRRRMWDWMRAAEWSEPADGALDKWEQVLGEGTEAERLRAAYALASRGAEAVPRLVAALRRQAAALRQPNLEADHTNPSQLDAVFGLSAVGAFAVPAVVALLDDEAWWVRAAAADVLGDMGETARERPRRGLRRPERRVGLGAAQCRRGTRLPGSRRVDCSSRARPLPVRHGQPRAPQRRPDAGQAGPRRGRRHPRPVPRHGRRGALHSRQCRGRTGTHRRVN